VARFHDFSSTPDRHIGCLNKNREQTVLYMKTNQML